MTMTSELLSGLCASLPTLENLELEERRRKYNMIDKYYPEQGKLSRHNYPKHMAFFEAGKVHRERCMMAGNRVGKTDAAVYEVTCHLTGKYPLWWNGRRFNHPIDVWASGDTGTTVRDILQKKLFGSYSEPGT